MFWPLALIFWGSGGVLIFGPFGFDFWAFGFDYRPFGLLGLVSFGLMFGPLINSVLSTTELLRGHIIGAGTRSS